MSQVVFCPDVAPICAAVVRAIERDETSWRELAACIGWFNGGVGDTRRLKRTLGLAPMGDGYVNRRMKYETALKIVQALGLDPVDYDV